MSGSAWVAFAALGLIWGVPCFFIKLAVQELAPVTVAFGRIALAALILLPLAWKRGALHSARSHLAPICGFAVAEFVIPFTAIAVGEQWIGSSVAAILIAMVPFSVTLIARWFGLHERLGAVRVLGLAMGLAGVIALVGFGPISGPRGWAGAGCMVLATLGYATGPLIVQRYLADMDSLGPVAASLGVASLILLPFAALNLPERGPAPAALFAVAVLGVVCTALAMLLLFHLVRSAGAARATLIAYINPAVAALLGGVALDERLGLGGIFAFALILFGSWLATRGPRAAV